MISCTRVWPFDTETKACITPLNYSCQEWLPFVMHSCPRRLLLEIFPYIRMQNRFFFLFDTQKMLPLNVQHQLRSPSNRFTTITMFSNLSDVSHSLRIQRSPAAVGIHMTWQLSRKTLMLKVESSSCLNISLEAQLFKMKTQGLKIC